MSSSNSDISVAQLLLNAQQALGVLPPAVLEVGQIFADAGYELALVGGPVRDAALGVVPHDFDLTTNARPEETERLLGQWGKVWDIGKEFGTIGAARGDLVVEVTTYRTEEYDASSRKPTVAYGDTLEGDLTRRDFTVNAMAVRLPEMIWVDPTGGLEDAAAQLLRTPVTAKQSFDDDPLRIMRAARFAAQLGFSVAPDVVAAMTEMAQRLEIVSAERICSELKRLMISDHPRAGLELMVDTGVADVVLPELSALRETADEHNRHKDVYEHTLTVVEQAIDLETGPDGPVPAPDFILRFAALMHDVGKPSTREFDADGKVSFHHHELAGARLTRKRMQALKFDKVTIKAVSHLVASHMRFYGYGEDAWTDSAVRRYVADAGDQLERLHRLTRADVTTRNQRKARRLANAYNSLEERIKKLAEEEELAAIRPELDGDDIMQILNLKPGRAVGAARAYLLDRRLERGPVEPEVAKAELLSWWEENRDGLL
ncbi:CCA tRNA nucleotidyltransferase [Boudabousia marimammalium]|uniref:CCA tRNA nucleotidyltransferase n=1 Tax=Boudabousia marimammalium TaxID=156892 RepID=UPI000A7F72E0|nr:CCA tRNA nucleotidyltransferase [Boudabousia marimammalium]